MVTDTTSIRLSEGTCSKTLSATQALQKPHHLDNVHLLTAILFQLTQLEDESQSITILWIPSHINIPGNDQVDLAAKHNLYKDHITRISTNLSQLIRNLQKTTFEILHIEHRSWVHAGSPSALWYKIVTDCNWDLGHPKHARAVTL